MDLFNEYNEKREFMMPMNLKKCVWVSACVCVQAHTALNAHDPYNE